MENKTLQAFGDKIREFNNNPTIEIYECANALFEIYKSECIKLLYYRDQQEGITRHEESAYEELFNDFQQSKDK